MGWYTDQVLPRLVDAALSPFTLCTVPDEGAILAEIATFSVAGPCPMTFVYSG